MGAAILSNSCWGWGPYRDRGLRYNTPTVGLWIPTDDYLLLLENLRSLVAAPLTFAGGGAYPVGRLGDAVEIHFQHYSSDAEAAEKWARRASRLPPSNDDLRVHISGSRNFTQSQLDRFCRLPYRHKMAIVLDGALDVSGAPAITLKADPPEPIMDDGIILWQVSRQIPRVADWMAAL